MTQPNLDFSAPVTVYAEHRAEQNAEQRRLTGAMWRLLAFLRERGGVGATNVELAERFGLRFSGRVSDLRCHHGFRIDADPEHGGTWRYTLQGGRDDV